MGVHGTLGAMHDHVPHPAAAAGHASLYPPPRPVAGTGASGGGIWRSLLRLMAGMLAGLVFGMAVAHFGFTLAGDGVPFVLLAGLLLGLWPNIVLHEAGHALAGMARGMRVIAAGIGPLRLERLADGWEVRRGGMIQGLGGFAALVPAAGSGSRADMAVMLAGGPGANLLTAALAVPLASLADGWVAAALQGFGLGALLLGLVNLLPLQSGGWRSDGRGLLDLVRDPGTATAMLRMNQLTALSIAGTRPRDWPDTLLPTGLADRAPAVARAAAGILLMLQATDRGRHEDADRHARDLTPLLWETPDGFRQHLAVVMAVHAVAGRRDLALLAAWRPLCEGGLVDLSAWRHWFDAELAAGEGRLRHALTALEQAREALPRLQDRATALLLEEWLAALAARLQTPRPSTA